jgi:hypothetical protein
MTWEAWLCDVAGVRWYPTLQDPADPGKLHWMVESIRKESPRSFLPMIQHHWAQEYSVTCRFNSKVKQALVESKVICQHGGLEQLNKTWFPGPVILKMARKYGVRMKLPILAMPEFSGDNDHISQWPSLIDIGVCSQLDLSFYRQTLSLLSNTGVEPSISVTKMGSLYKNIGSRVTLEDQAILKACSWLSLVDMLVTIPRKTSRRTPSSGIRIVVNGTHWTNVSGKARFH